MRGSENLDCEWSELLGEKPGEYQFKLSFFTSQGVYGAHGPAASFSLSPRLNVTGTYHLPASFPGDRALDGQMIPE